jgi:hypothetical protein
MTFGELICRVALLRFDDDAQLGARISPVNIDAADAADLAAVAKRILPPHVYVAIAAPGAETVEEDRLCVAPGERAAERATAWRNRLSADGTERILYVSARRLGKAGGLQDTLCELTESELRRGFVRWLASAASGMPAAIGEALASSGAADLADARALTSFAASVIGAPDPLAAAGKALPLLGLAADSRLSEAPTERLAANVKLTRAAGAGDARVNRSDAPALVAAKQALGRAISEADGPPDSAALAAVDLGSLGLADLTGEAARRRAPKPKAPAAPSRPTSPPVRPSAPKPPPRPRARTNPTPYPTTNPTSEGPSAASVEASPAAPPVAPEIGQLPIRGHLVLTVPDADNSPPTPSTDGRAIDQTASTEAAPRLDDEDGGDAVPDADAEPPSEECGPDADATEPSSVDATEPTQGEPSFADPVSGDAPPAADAAAGPQDFGQARPGGELIAPTKRARRRSAVQQGPWSEAMHDFEIGRAAPLPEGAAALLVAGLERDGEPLEWFLRTDAHGEVLAKLPRGFGEAQVRTRPMDASLVRLVEAWRDARSALIATLGGADATLDALYRVPYTALGYAPVQSAAAALVGRSDDLLLAAAALGPGDAAGALAFDTVALRSVSGRETVLLSPVHPLVVGQLLARVPAFEHASKARGLIRTLLARATDVTLRAPSAWPPSPSLQPSCPVAGVVGFETEPRAVSALDLQGIAWRLLSRLVDTHPSSLLGARVSVAAGDPEPIVTGLAEYTTADPRLRTLWVHVDRSVTADSANALITANRLELVAEADRNERPHMSLRVVAGDVVRDVAPPGWEPGARSALSACGVQDAAVLGTGRADLAPWAPGSMDDAGWEAVIAPHVTGPPRANATVIIRDRFGNADVAVVTRDIRGASRLLEETFRKLGVEDFRPRTMRALAAGLASVTGSLLPLAGSVSGSVAGQLLELALFERLGDQAQVARLGPDDASLWCGDDVPEGDAVALALTARDGRLRIVLGYGTLDPMNVAALAQRIDRASEIAAAMGRPSTAEAGRTLVDRTLVRAGLPRLGTEGVRGCTFSVLAMTVGGAAITTSGAAPLDLVEAGPQLLERLVMGAGRRR